MRRAPYSARANTRQPRKRLAHPNRSQPDKRWGSVKHPSARANLRLRRPARQSAAWPHPKTSSIRSLVSTAQSRGNRRQPKAARPQRRLECRTETRASKRPGDRQQGQTRHSRYLKRLRGFV